MQAIRSPIKTCVTLLILRGFLAALTVLIFAGDAAVTRAQAPGAIGQVASFPRPQSDPARAP